MQPMDEAEALKIEDKCVLGAIFFLNDTATTEMKNCDIGNPCLDSSCDPVLGCVRVPNTKPCEDGNLCTVNDTCSAGQCLSGTARVCDDGLVCNGVETCSPAVGCEGGNPPTCDDLVVCTDDSCSDLEGGCVHAWREDAVEGPRGDPRCDDGQDNDCDGVQDADDPKCRFGLTSANPIDGPTGGGTVVTLSGDSLDRVLRVRAGDVEVGFTPVSATAITVVMPPHDPGFVDFVAEAATVSFRLDQAFRYVTRSEDPTVTALLLGPLGEAAIREGEQAPTYEAMVTVPGITDGEDPEASAVLGQVGYGPRGTMPWMDPSWRWSNAAGVPDGLGSLRFTGTFTAATGGYMDVTARFSIDGGASWVYADLDGTANGYAADQILWLAVLGVPRPGAVVINEILWAGSYQEDLDEWVELRNMTAAPYLMTGWVLTGMKYPSGDITLDEAPQVVGNLLLEPYGYFRVAQYEASRSQVEAQPDIAMQPASSPQTAMNLPNSGYLTYSLKAPDGTLVDQARFNNGRVGFHGTPANGKPVQSMERNAVPGTGLLDSDWHSATIATGFLGDPRQVLNLGTPRGPNADIPLCEADDECTDSFPDEVLTQCEARVCRQPQGRCGVVAIGDGGACEDGLFCTVGETCSSGACGNGQARDCSDPLPLGPCTLDRCDEDLDECVHDRDPAALEGPAGSPACAGSIDEDCDGLTDMDDPQCGLEAISLTPSPIPATGGWEMTLKGTGLDIVTGVELGGQPAASFLTVDASTITFSAPPQTGPGDVEVRVTDGQVTASLAAAVRVIDLAPIVLANTQWPTDPLLVDLGTPTPLIFGRVYAEGITNGESPTDPALLIAEIGYGPADDLEADPYRDPGWTWLPAQYNAACPDCAAAGLYEYMLTLQPPAAGDYLVAYRFSVDGGFRYQFGKLGEPAATGWDPLLALVLTVQAPAP